MEKAKFQFIGYKFNKISIDYSNYPADNPIEISFNPHGTYSEEKSLFNLFFVFKASQVEGNKLFAEISCEGDFQFPENLEFNEIPDYFYLNSIAILFPYIRAFISIITIQTNQAPFILPTLNLSYLKEELKKNSKKL